LDKFLAIFAAEEVEAAVIGRFADDRVLRVRYKGQTVGEMDMRFLHEGLPKTTRIARWSQKNFELSARPVADAPGSEGKRLLDTLRTLNVASKEWIIRQYDHEVQGRSVIKPLVGPAFGPSDAAVLRPVYTSRRGIAVGCGLCPHWSQADPYWMAVRAIDEAFRNVICVGADPQRVAILDNFCWPKVDTEESLGALVRTCRGAHDAAVAYGLPFISGKDSLNNEFSMSAEESKRTGLPQQIAIPPTLLISALGIVEDVGRCVSMDFKTPGNVLVLASNGGRALLVDQSRDREGAGKHEVQISKFKEKEGVATPSIEPRTSYVELGVPGFELAAARTVHYRVAALIRDGKVRAAHDVSDGGLAVALAEMCIASGFGATVEVDAAMYAHSLFDESAACYVLEMAADTAAEAGLPTIGRVTVEPRLRIAGGAGEAIDLAVRALDTAWRAPLAAGGGR
jgi:phosphoribosylformylglycinamidine synthase